MKKRAKVILGVSIVALAVAGFLLYKRYTDDNGGYGGGNGLRSTPFETTSDGNAFRFWVNFNYPDYARTIDLDLTGEYNNSYIKKAYMKYGIEYEKR
jgi:hypothetical protein